MDMIKSVDLVRKIGMSASIVRDRSASLGIKSVNIGGVSYLTKIQAEAIERFFDIKTAVKCQSVGFTYRKPRKIRYCYSF